MTQTKKSTMYQEFKREGLSTSRHTACLTRVQSSQRHAVRITSKQSKTCSMYWFKTVKDMLYVPVQNSQNFLCALTSLLSRPGGGGEGRREGEEGGRGGRRRGTLL